MIHKNVVTDLSSNSLPDVDETAYVHPLAASSGTRSSAGGMVSPFARCAGQGHRSSWTTRPTCRMGDPPRARDRAWGHAIEKNL